MKIKGNLIIFSTDNEERKDVRKLKEKKLQILLDENNDFPSFDITEKEYIKRTAEHKIEELFNTTKFYIEQLYTWGDPYYCPKNTPVIVTYLVIINKRNIGNMPKNMSFYSINIEDEEKNNQKVILENDKKEIKYNIETIVKKERQSVEYLNR